MHEISSVGAEGQGNGAVVAPSGELGVSQERGGEQDDIFETSHLRENSTQTASPLEESPVTSAGEERIFSSGPLRTEKRTQYIELAQEEKGREPHSSRENGLSVASSIEYTQDASWYSGGTATDGGFLACSYQRARADIQAGRSSASREEPRGADLVAKASPGTQTPYTAPVVIVSDDSTA
ncbi:hypothetical protein CSUI_005379, partial [Cystoisospora suis]